MRRFPVRAAMAACVGVAGSAASAQISSVGPFTGSLQETFEVNPGYSCPPCFQACIDGVFGGAASMCDASGGTGMSITSGWSFQCVIFPFAGARFFGSAGGPTQIKFKDTVTKFGGYMGDNGLQGAGTAEFLDENGAAIGSPQPLSLNGCSWVWNGWESTTPIKAVKLTGVTYGGFVMLDNLEAEGGAAPCYPDCNLDTFLTVADFGCFQTAFVAGTLPYADCNGDTFLTVADFGCFQTAFVAGCP